MKNKDMTIAEFRVYLAEGLLKFNPDAPASEVMWFLHAILDELLKAKYIEKKDL